MSARYVYNLTFSLDVSMKFDRDWFTMKIIV